MNNKIYIVFLFVFLMMGLATAITISSDDCSVIEGGIFAGKTVCYAGTIEVTAGEVTTLEVNIIDEPVEEVVEEVEEEVPIIEEELKQLKKLKKLKKKTL